MVLRRRLLGIAKTVKITFYGNGRSTPSGEDVVVVMATVGATWESISKPKFLLAAARQQGGFTIVQNDDDTAIESDCVITNDMIVYASYTVIEVGVITHAGEVLSVAKWISKYGLNCYESQGSGMNFRWILKESMRGNLVEFIYFKANDEKAFALASEYMHTDGNLQTSSWDDHFCEISLNLRPIWSGVDARFVNYVYDSENHADYSEMIFPFMHNPPDYTSKGMPQEAIDYLFGLMDGKAYCEAFYNATVEAGSVSPVLKKIREWNVGELVPEGSFYVASPGEMYMIAVNRQKFLDAYSALEQWSHELKPPADEQYSVLGYAYWEVENPNNFGFRNHHYKLSETQSGSSSIYQCPVYAATGKLAYGATATDAVYTLFRFDLPTQGLSYYYGKPLISAGNVYSQANKFIIADVSHLF
jgi:hypothetical protein